MLLASASQKIKLSKAPCSPNILAKFENKNEKGIMYADTQNHENRVNLNAHISSFFLGFEKRGLQSSVVERKEVGGQMTWSV